MIQEQKHVKINDLMSLWKLTVDRFFYQVMPWPKKVLWSCVEAADFEVSIACFILPLPKGGSFTDQIQPSQALNLQELCLPKLV